MKKHIPERDCYTHIVTVCGKFPKNVEECMTGEGVCVVCLKRFQITKEQHNQEIKDLIEQGKKFVFK